MAELGNDIIQSMRNCFPLESVESVVELFREELTSGNPNLAALSLAVGYIEHHLTDKKSIGSNSRLGLHEHKQCETFPRLEWDVFEDLLTKYYKLVEEKISFLRTFSNDVDCQNLSTENVNDQLSERQQVKAIADFVWCFLSKSFFKDRPHLQSIYSFLNGKRLDCFGVAFVVVSTAQYLGINNIHLALSEDHAWVTFGEHNKETAEVTWHGKADEQKRGNPVTQDNRTDFMKNWLYLAGHEVKCNRSMEVAALVSGLNPEINSKTDSETLGQIQQELLWLLFDYGHLDRYPMAICNLADLEEIVQSRQSIRIEDLYEKAIRISESEYMGYHVYPYTYYGGYLFRKRRYMEATKIWCHASKAASRYTHSREDEELYKDLHEIANSFFPEIAKRCRSKENKSEKRENYFETDDNFINILNFYDGVCLWEQGGHTLAIHSEWAKNFARLISSFSFETRTNCMQQSCSSSLGNDYDTKGDCLPSSQKMNLLKNVVADEKVNTQVVNLHMTSHVGLNSGEYSNNKRDSDRFPEDGRASRKRTR